MSIPIEIDDSYRNSLPSYFPGNRQLGRIPRMCVEPSELKWLDFLVELTGSTLFL